MLDDDVISLGTGADLVLVPASTAIDIARPLSAALADC